MQMYPFDKLTSDGEFFLAPISKLDYLKNAAYRYTAKRGIKDWRITVIREGDQVKIMRVPLDWYGGRGPRTRISDLPRLNEVR